MSRKTASKTPKLVTQADALDAASKALAAACEALRAVELREEADALAAAGADLDAVHKAASAAIGVFYRWGKQANAATMALHDEWLLARAAAEADDSWWGDARYLLEHEQEIRSIRYRALTSRWDDACNAVENASSALKYARDTHETPEMGDFWYRRGLQDAASAILSSRGACARRVILRRGGLAEGWGAIVEVDGEARKFWPPEEAQARFCALTGYPSNRLWPYPTIAPALAAPTERTSP